MLKNLMGVKAKNVAYYIQAITHSSITEDYDSNNERLEYLGDAILGAVIAEYLYLKFPNEHEGFLTEMRSKIVSRNSLNEIAKEMGMLALMNFNEADKNLKSSHIFGNALESFIGAIYLDHGYEKTKKYILQVIVKNHVDLKDLLQQGYNLKNKIISWAQKNKKELDFNDADCQTVNGRKIFYIDLLLDKKCIATGTGYTKKEAGEKAAELALDKLNIQMDS